jgi:hypothetical protein
MNTDNKKVKQVGRKPKADPCRHRLAINLLCSFIIRIHIVKNLLVTVQKNATSERFLALCKSKCFQVLKIF